ncbi:hypothetical protein [Lactobacillus juensis]|uniref:hypothetical protein n=1 Tax=Lactobacillus juensis TaxID=3082862 RepID=UPI0030C6B6DA
MKRVIAYNQTKELWLSNIITDNYTKTRKPVFEDIKNGGMIFSSKKEALRKTNNLATCENDEWQFENYVSPINHDSVFAKEINSIRKSKI